MSNALLEMNLHMGPTRVELELTELCNLRCTFCYNSQKPIVSDKVIQIIEKLVDENVMEIILTGGEPMTHPKFYDILDKCCENFSKVMIQTNGTYIDQKAADVLAKHDLFGVNISLHGDKTKHEKLTLIDGSYEKAFDAIKLLIERKIHLASNFVITKENIDSLEETIEYLYGVGLRELTLTRFTPTGIGADNVYLAIDKNELVAALYIAKEKMEKYSDFKIILANSIPACALPEELEFFSDHCHFGISRFYIDVNGNVMMCGMSRIKIGNMLEESFYDIKSKSKIYCDHVCGEDVPLDCKECNQFKTCRGGCRAAAYAVSNKVDGADPYMCK